jgi:GxxExxY protein
MQGDVDRHSYTVIGMAMECHRELGPGLREILYHKLLAKKLRTAGVPHRYKPKGALMHRRILADEFEADMVVDAELALELKVLSGTFAADNFLQIICYMKFWRLPAGLLFDFGKESLIFRRVLFTEPAVSFDVPQWVESAPPFVSDRVALKAVAIAIRNVLEAHGLGYRESSYRGLMSAELIANDIEVVPEPVVSIRSADETPLGDSKLYCLVMPGRCAVYVTALRDARQAADRAVLQTYLKHLGLAWGVTVNFGKSNLSTQFVRSPRSRTV